MNLNSVILTLKLKVMICIFGELNKKKAHLQQANGREEKSTQTDSIITGVGKIHHHCDSSAPQK